MYIIEALPPTDYWELRRPTPISRVVAVVESKAEAEYLCAELEAKGYIPMVHTDHNPIDGSIKGRRIA